MSETQNFKNIGWSPGLQGRKSESTTPRLRGCVLVHCWSWPADGLTGRGGAEISEIEKAHGSNGGERRNVIPFHFFGDFNWPRNHDETDPKITMLFENLNL